MERVDGFPVAAELEEDEAFGGENSCVLCAVAKDVFESLEGIGEVAVAAEGMA